MITCPGCGEDLTPLGAVPKCPVCGANVVPRVPGAKTAQWLLVVIAFAAVAFGLSRCVEREVAYDVNWRDIGDPHPHYPAIIRALSKTDAYPCSLIRVRKEIRDDQKPPSRYLVQCGTFGNDGGWDWRAVYKVEVATQHAKGPLAPDEYPKAYGAQPEVR